MNNASALETYSSCNYQTHRNVFLTRKKMSFDKVTKNLDARIFFLGTRFFSCSKINILVERKQNLGTRKKILAAGEIVLSHQENIFRASRIVSVGVCLHSKNETLVWGSSY